MDKKHHSAGIWLAISAAFCLSMKAIFIKLAYHWPIEAITLLALRMAFSLPFFLAVGLRESRKSPPLSPKQRLAIVLLGVIGYYAAAIFDFSSLRHISATLERLALFSYPMLTLLFGAMFFGQPIRRRDIAALLLCYAGIGAAFAHDLHLSADMRAVWIGGSFALACSFCYAIYFVGSGRMVPVIGSSRFVSLALLSATGATLLHFLLTQPLHALILPWQVYALALGMALLSTVFPGFATASAIRRIGAGRVSLISNIGPVLTIFLSWQILGEPVTGWQWIGTALVVAGVLLVSRK